MGFPGCISGKEPACQCRRHERCGFDPWARKMPWRRACQPTLVLLPGGLQFIGSQRVGHDWSDLACTQEGSICPCYGVSGVGWKIILLTSMYLGHTALICSFSESGWSGVVSSICQQYLCSAFVYSHLSIIKVALGYNHL